MYCVEFSTFFCLKNVFVVFFYIFGILTMFRRYFDTLVFNVSFVFVFVMFLLMSLLLLRVIPGVCFDVYCVFGILTV